MTKSVFQVKEFRKDLKRVRKQGKDLNKLKLVVKKLSNSETLEAKYRDHALSNNWRGYRDCHIEPNWLLIYKIDHNSIILYRTGSHSDIFC